MAAILLDIREGDEVIMPSFTFVSTANAFILRGAKIVFADSYANNPNIDAGGIEHLITNKTKAIVVVHYAGVACDMDAIMALSERYKLYVVEDAAQAIDSYYIGRDGTKRALGSIGHIAAFSFHETKNIVSGEGGLLVINDEQFEDRSEIIWEKGTNRSAFFRGELDKYGWVDVGSSFLPSEMVAAYLFGQLENLERIQDKRKHIADQYRNLLKDVNFNTTGLSLSLPVLPDYATENGHLFYLLMPTFEIRQALIDHLRKKDIHAVFHYLSLHKSTYFVERHDGRRLKNCDNYANCLVRLPFFYELTEENITEICSEVRAFVTKCEIGLI
jgi:dTDP-4-amino-4,6-dideoxygalactose transaminase